VLLAIDSSSGTSVAIVDRDRGVRVRAVEPDPRRHAEVVGALISECLRSAGVRPGDLDGVVAGMGPGPFTGLRVGIAAARAFAFGAGLAVHPLVSHDAIALGAYRGGLSGPLVVATDARRRERYWSGYDGLGAEGIPRRVRGPALAPADAVPAGGVLVADEAVDAALLADLASAILAAGGRFAEDRALYLREPDAVPGAPKRVTA